MDERDSRDNEPDPLMDPFLMDSRPEEDTELASDTESEDDEDVEEDFF